MLPVVELRADVHGHRAPSSPTSSAAPRTSTSARSTRPPGASPTPRTSPSSTAGSRRGIRGIAEACTHPAVALSEDFNHYSRHTAEAVETLLRSGIGGPYALALGPDQYTGVIQSTEHGGYPLFDHLKKILGGGPIVWAPGVRGAVVVSLRGGDFLFESGQDLSIGYDHHDAELVHLYLEESFSFRVATPEAACFLKPAG